MERIHAAFSCGVIIWTMADCQSIILPSLLLLPESILADDHLTSELAKGIQSTDFWRCTGSVKIYKLQRFDEACLTPIVGLYRITF